jgi:hypothetical protein
MCRIWIATISCLALSCAGPHAGPTPRVLCLASPPTPATWLEVEVPASTAHIRVPPTYTQESGRWRGPNGSILIMTSAARTGRVSRHREGDRFSVRPASCEMRLGTRLVRFTPWAVIPPEGRTQHVVSATWDESEGSNIIITAHAEDTKSRWEQLTVLHSLR